MYACPLCQQSLVRQSQQWVCQQRHSFDIAKEGYVNLLPVQNKRSSNPGDNAEMMQARRDFLNQGFYYPLVEKLAQIIQPLLPADPLLLDLGCGEGYYTQALNKILSQTTNANPHFWGLDISKTAIRYAAKRDYSIQFSVASAYKLPFFENMFNVVTRIYAPSEANELLRVIKPGGYLLTVQPGAKHLFELKQAIYATPRQHDEQTASLDGFKSLGQQALSYPIQFRLERDLLNLINMTPFGWKLNNEQKNQLSQTIDLVQADFLIHLHQKLPQ